MVGSGSRANVIVAHLFLDLKYFCLSAAGLVLHFTIVPLNTDLYSVSFLLLTAGAAGLMLSFFYVCVDLRLGSIRCILQPFLWLGTNAIAMYSVCMVGYS
jgi:heparan-alpha-glucosaminide N-acetyltransferase